MLSRSPRLADGNNEDILSEAAAGGRWMIFTDQEGVGQSLVELLPASGHSFTVVPRDRFESIGANFRMQATNADQFRRLFQVSVGAVESPLEGVVYVWPLDAATLEGAGGLQFSEAVQRGCESLLHLVKEMVSDGNTKAKSLWIVTRGAYSVGLADERATFAQDSISAIAGTIAEIEACAKV